MNAYKGASLIGLLVAGYVAQRYLPPPPPKLVGLDLGTTYSSIGVYQAVNGEARVLADLQGRRSIPSVVGFLPNGTIYVGYDAVAHAERNPTGTIYDAKRFIGKHFTPAELEKEANRYPFKVVLINESRAAFEVPDAKLGVRLVSPEEIGSLVLKHLLKMAKRDLGAQMTRAVISVPAEFNDEQRNATIKAGNLAGLEIFRVINEPTAAALAYGLHRKPGVDHVLIVDLGGGTLDVSLLAVQAGMFLTRAMAGNNHLGGQDFNQRLFTYLVGLIEAEVLQGAKMTNAEDLQNLRQATETAKLELTYRRETHVVVPLPSISDRTLFQTTVTRDQFEALIEDLLLRVLSPIRAVLDDVGVSPDDVDEVVLVGGSTRIPRVQTLIKDFFAQSGRPDRVGLNQHIDPDLAVVTGVAVQAGVMGGGWPLTVSAVELPSKLKKIHVYQ